MPQCAAVVPVAAVKDLKTVRVAIIFILGMLVPLVAWAQSPINRVPGHVFRDCADCPDMVVVPPGEFLMGSNEGTPSEKPVHKVTISRAFAVGKFHVTFLDWDACVLAGGCNYSPRTNPLWGRGTRPVVNVSWDDATREYLPWISRKTSKAYRLLTEAEYEYATRGSTNAAAVHTTYSWGNDLGSNRANCKGCGSQWDNKRTAPVGSFPPNAFGLHDMQGNVWTLVQDCYHDSYQGAPTDDSAWTTGDCDSRVMRGGDWFSIPWFLRASARLSRNPVFRNDGTGFRLARTLDE
jgi:formylglycine-generating enzyme required for sulfatase activity